MAFAGRQIGDLTIARALEIVSPFDPLVVLSGDHTGRLGPARELAQAQGHGQHDRRAAVPGPELPAAHGAPHDPDRLLRRQPQGTAPTGPSGTRRPTIPTCARWPRWRWHPRRSTTSCAPTCTSTTSAGTRGSSTAAGSRPSPMPATRSRRPNSTPGSRATRNSRAPPSRTACCR